MSIEFYAMDINRFCDFVAGDAPETKYHAVFCDAPYHNLATVKRFGKMSSAPPKQSKDGAFLRAARKFIGQTWDGGQVAFEQKTWENLLRVTLPGAFFHVFSGDRTYHRMASAMEQAGIIMHGPYSWLYLTGQTKPHWVDDWGEDYAYGPLAVAPAVEFVARGQAPFVTKTQIASILENGTGAINIGALRGDDGKYPRNIFFQNGLQAYVEKMQHGVSAFLSWVDYEPEWYEQQVLDNCGFQFCPKPSKTEKDAGTSGNGHATVKPMNLTYMLAKSLLPPPTIGERRMLVPFAGSGTEAIGAALAGWNVTAVEISHDYVELAKRRADWWLSMSEKFALTEPREIIKAAKSQDVPLYCPESTNTGQ